MKIRWPLPALCLGIFLIYLPTLAQGFQFDDDHMVADNQFIKDWKLLPRAFFTSSISSVGVAKGMYRPVLVASYAWNYAWGGLNPIGFHLTNVWLHLLVTCLAIGLARRLWPGVSSGWVVAAAALWALHPIHSQPVAYISSRSVTLTSLFLLLSLWLHCASFPRTLSFPRKRESTKSSSKSLIEDPDPRFREDDMEGTASRQKRWLCRIGAWTAFLLGLGSKEIAVTFVGLVCLVEWRLRQARGGERLRSAAVRIAPYLLLTGLYLVWRKALIGSIGVVYPVRTWGENTWMQLEGVLAYLRLWIFPDRLSVVQPQPEGTLWGAVAGLAALAAAGASAFRLRRRLPGWAFAVGWGIVSFVPVALASSLNLVVSEQHAYWPSLGLALGLPPILQALAGPSAGLRAGPSGRRRILVGTLCGVLAAGLSGATFQRVLVWRNDLSLWSDAVRKAPRMPHAHNNLGLAYEARADPEKAFTHYARSVALSPPGLEQSTGYHNLGCIYLKTGQPEEALAQFHRAIELNPKSAAMSFNNAGLAYRDLKQPEQAEAYFRRALEANPWVVEAHLNLASLLFDQGKREGAGRHFERAFEIQPDQPMAAEALGRFYASQGEWAQAHRMFRVLTRIAPRAPEGYLYLAAATLKMDPAQGAQADRYLERAAALSAKGKSAKSAKSIEGFK